MRCTSPRTVGFASDGKTIVWSQRLYDKQYPVFSLPCGKCLDCRLEYSRQWAVRCVHEAQMHTANCFVTLTYEDDSLAKKLDYSHFQKFMKRLRKLQNEPISFFVTGEYGEKTKRGHWHAIIFNWAPRDSRLKYTSKRGDKVYESETLTDTWSYGIAEFGSVTYNSAGYVARYAAKKLGHGNDGEHEYEPISKKSSKNAIGKSWLEKFWPDIFNYGKVVVEGRPAGSIPRYYEKWLSKNHPDAYLKYVINLKADRIARAQHMAEKEKAEYIEVQNKRLDEGKLTHTPSRNKVREAITNYNMNQLRKYQKL